MSIFFKGAGPGTHWWNNDARLQGFSVSPGMQNINAIIRHITAYSYPSPYLSFTASFAVAQIYALVGPDGLATQSMPGYVYEIDVTTDPTAGLRLIDPIQEILASNPPLGTVPLLPTHHDGGQDLILAIASPGSYPTVLATPPPRPGNPIPTPPIVQRPFQAVIFVLRDAEILVATHVSPACIIHRHNVY